MTRRDLPRGLETWKTPLGWRYRLGADEDGNYIDRRTAEDAAIARAESNRQTTGERHAEDPATR